MTNFLDQIPTKVIGTVDQAGQVTIATQRQTLLFNGATVSDDPFNERTIVNVESLTTLSTLSDILDNGNNALGKTIINLGSPTNSGDAANKSYVDSKDLENVLTVDPSANNLRITNLGNPINPLDGVNKAYVDGKIETTTTSTGTLSTSSTYQLMTTIPLVVTSGDADTYFLRIFNSLTKKISTLTLSVYNNAGTYSYQYEGSVVDNQIDGYLAISGFQIKTTISGSNLLVYGLGSASVQISYKVSWQKNITYKPNDYGNSLFGTISPGTSYQTLTTISLTDLASGEYGTLHCKLFTSKKNKIAQVTYNVMNDAGTMKIVNVENSSDIGSSDITYLTNLQYIKMLVSGTNLLVQILQESGQTYSFKFNYVLWEL